MNSGEAAAQDKWATEKKKARAEAQKRKREIDEAAGGPTPAQTRAFKHLLK